MGERAFRIPPEWAQRVQIGDILLSAMVAFCVLPAVGAAFGVALHSLGPNSPFAELSGLLFALGLSGLFAWPLAPIVIGISWWARRRGWVGWASATATGILLGYAYSVAISYFWLFANDHLATILLGCTLFATFGAFYAIAGWLALRWLCPEGFSSN